MKLACRNSFDGLDDNLVLNILQNLPDSFDRRAWRLSCKRFLFLEANCRTRLHPVNMEVLPFLLHRHTCVQCLDLTSCSEVTDEGLRTIVCLLGKQLLSLNLSQCWTFTDAGIAALAPGCSSLIHLDLSLCIQVTDAGLIGIGQIKSLQSLKLDQCDSVTDDGMTIFAAACRSLRCLSLRGCTGITDTAIEAVSHYCEGLRELDLSYTEITNKALKSVVKLSLLTKLSLVACHGVDDDGFHNFKMGGKCLKALDISRCPAASHRGIKGLMNSTSLQELSLSHCGLVTNAMLQGLQSFCLLQTLRFNGCDVSAADLGLIGRSFRNLKELSLCTCRGVTETELLAVVAGCTNLQKLDLTCCREVTDAGLSSVARLCKGLSVLKMESCSKISGNGLSELGELCPRLEELDLTNSALNDTGLKSVARCRNLSVLKMGVCSFIHDLGLSYVASNCSKLTVLDIYRSEEVNDAGIVAICDGCPRLKSLNVSYCRLLTDAALFAIAQLRELGVLEIRGCFLISSVGLVAVAKRCERLRELDIKHCSSVEESAALALAKCCKNLRQINMSYCSATDEGVIALAELSCMSNMKLIHVKNISAYGVEQLLLNGINLKKVTLPFFMRGVVEQELIERVELRGCRIKWMQKEA